MRHLLSLILLLATSAGAWGQDYRWGQNPLAPDHAKLWKSGDADYCGVWRFDSKKYYGWDATKKVWAVGVDTPPIPPPPQLVTVPVGAVKPATDTTVVQVHPPPGEGSSSNEKIAWMVGLLTAGAGVLWNWWKSQNHTKEIAAIQAVVTGTGDGKPAVADTAAAEKLLMEQLAKLKGGK